MQLTSERARETSIERERERELEIDWLLLRQCGKGLSLWPVQAPHPVTMFWGRGPTKVFSVVAHSDHRTGKGPFCVANSRRHDPKLYTLFHFIRYNRQVVVG